jgi:hypothetical protein
VAEIGVGSGFLLCSMIRALSRRPLSVVGSDIDEVAIATARANVEYLLDEASVHVGVDVRLERDARMLQRVPAESLDVLLSNPPYIPERSYAGENAYSGTRVIAAFMLDHGPRVLAPGGVAVMLYSSLASVAVAAYLERSPLVAIPLAPGRRVPFDVRDVGSDPAWMALLRREHGLEETLVDPAYVNWHTLHVLALCRAEDLELAEELRALAGGVE